MQVSQVDLKSLGIDPLRGRAKEGTGWPENNRDEKWDWSYYCLTCKLEVKRPYLCKAERRLNKTVYSPTTPNWILNRPPSLKPRCPQCRELDKLITKQQRIDYFKNNISLIYEEEKRLKNFQKKWKKFRKKNYDLLFNNSNYKIPRESLTYKDQDMWQCHINLLQYIEDYSGMFMPRSESTKEDLKLVWELDHKYSNARKQNEKANLMLNSGNIEINQKNYSRAQDYYNRSIKARIDRTDLYLARALLYLQTGQYKKCITDCTIIILMIDHVHIKLKQSGVYVNAYYNRAKSYKFLNNLLYAKKDLKDALQIDEDDINCKKLLSEIDTILLFEKNNNNNIDLVDESLKFLQDASDKTPESEYKLFFELFKLIKENNYNNIYSKKFIHSGGIILCLNYVRSKFKISNSKDALKDLGKPGMDMLFVIINNILPSKIIIENNKKLISNIVLYVFTLYTYMHSILQNEALKFATFMFNILCIKECIQNNYLKPLMERFKKLNRKIKRVDTPIFDVCILKCMIGLFSDNNTHKDIKINNKIGEMYNNNEILYEWMSKYIKYCNKLNEKDIKNYNISFNNLFDIFSGVINSINYSNNNSFYMLYNQNKQKQFTLLIEYFNKLKKLNILEIDINELNNNNNLILINYYKIQIKCIIFIITIINALCNKEQGRKWLLDEKQFKNKIYENMINIIQIIKNKNNNKYKNIININNNNINIYINNIFRKLIQQEQDNNEQKEIDQKLENQRKIKREKEQKEKDEKERLEKEKKTKQAKEKEKEKEQKDKKPAKDGDLDALSDDDKFNEEEYLKNIEMEQEERKKKNKKKKQKKNKKKKKKDDDDEISNKPFVSQWEPAKYDKDTMKKVFGNQLSMNEIDEILNIELDK